MFSVWAKSMKLFRKGTISRASAATLTCFSAYTLSLIMSTMTSAGFTMWTLPWRDFSGFPRFQVPAGEFPHLSGAKLPLLSDVLFLDPSFSRNLAGIVRDHAQLSTTYIRVVCPPDLLDIGGMPTQHRGLTWIYEVECPIPVEPR